MGTDTGHPWPDPLTNQPRVQTMNRNQTARQHNFAIVPSADIPRSRFAMRQTRKQAFNASELIPIMVEEVLPGDTWSHRESILARLATPIAPLMDDMDLETFYFFVPNRILWDDWEDFITGLDPTLTVPNFIPTIGVPPTGQQITLNSVLDHMGLPLITFSAPSNRLSALPILAYFKIWNEWFRDQNLQEEWQWPDINTWGTGLQTQQITQDGDPWQQQCLRINKRSDYFTRALPWPQKGNPVMLPLGVSAPVIPTATPISPQFRVMGEAGLPLHTMRGVQASSNVQWDNPPINVTPTTSDIYFAGETGLVTDLALATSATINAIRLAFQTQKLLERDARGGSRYIEQLLSHFGVRAPDFRLQRPEYLGGAKIPITINPIAQTAAYSTEPAAVESAIGNLGAEMHASSNRNTFRYAATEHGYIIGLACVRATPTYQQGIRRHWGRQTRLQYFFPVFSHVGEQAVNTREIFLPPDTTPDNETWGYQEAWAEYRYTPNEITGVLRSTAPQPLDWWHLSEEFANEPALNDFFIQDKTQEVLTRALATAPSEQWSAQILMDILHQSQVGRLMPAYSDPGMIDHF